jgi:hypothetical protein
MKTKYVLSTLLAAGLAAVTHAQVVSVEPDLIVGFQQSGTPTDYEVDLGSMSNYLGLATDTAINLSGDISATDLKGIFGSNALTGGTVTWAGAATVGANATTLNGVAVPAFGTFVTQFDSIQTGLTPGVTPPVSEFKGAGTSILHTREGAVGNLYTGLNGATSLSTPEAAAISTGSFSYDHWMNSSTVNGFGAGFDAPTALSLTSGEYSVIDLFQYGSGTTNPGTYIGSLELSSTGGLSFTNFVPTAIPEPSTYAAILGAACLSFVAIRRRKQQVIA